MNTKKGSLCAGNVRLQALAGCAWLALSWGQAAAQTTEAVEVDIVSQDLSDALIEFGRQAGVEVVFTPQAVADKQAAAVQGAHAPQEAIAILLADTGMQARRTQDGVYVVEQRMAQLETEAVPSARPLAEPLPTTDRVTVTGSRIVRDGMASPTPVTLMSADELSDMSPATIMDALQQLPQFANNNTAVGFADGVTGSAGASNLNLRGIGPNRTLTLLDGRRVVPSTRRGWVDVSLFPESLIERVEIVTGGASAAYGSDAVSGVANFILDTDFVGIEGHAQAGVTDRDDNENYELSLAYGVEIGARGHLVLAAERFSSQGIKGYANRDWFQSWGNILNPDPNGPDEIIVPGINIRSYTNGGYINSGPLAGTQFLEGGVPAPFVNGTIVGGSVQQGGSGFDDGRVSTWILPDQERNSAFGHFKFDLTDSVEVYVQALYGKSVTEFEAVPNGQQANGALTIYRDNAYLDAVTRERMIAAGVQSFPMVRIASERDLGAALVVNDAEMVSLTTGFDAILSNDWTLNGYYQYGRTNEVRTWEGVVRQDRMYRAADAVVNPANGQIVCRSTLTFPDDGCVPVNLFGDGSPSEAAKAYLLSESYADQVVTQHAAEVSLQGELFEGWAGPVSFATGGSYRKDEFDQVAGPPALAALRVPTAASQGYRGLPSSTAGAGIFERANPSTVAGGYDVWEVFGETLVPLLSNSPVAQSLDFSGAVRYADYQGSGGVWAWKGGLDWQVVEDVRLRATRSRDVRAGNLSERFDTTGRGGTVERDVFLPGRPSYVVTLIEGGNANVDPEKADTLTFGGVYRPSWLPGFAFSVDYFDVQIADAISQLGVQNIVDQCFAGASGLCDLITRDPATGRISQVENVFLNVAEARTRGIDFEASYSTDLNLFGGGETLSFRAFASNILELSTTNFGAAKVDRAGQTGRYVAAPEWRGTFNVNYQRGPLGVYVQQRFIGSGERDVLDVEGIDIDDNSISGAMYTNLRLSYEFNDGAYEVFGNVTNLFDKDPPRAPTANAYSTVHTNEELFDPLGRRYTVGVRFRY